MVTTQRKANHSMRRQIVLDSTTRDNKNTACWVQDYRSISSPASSSRSLRAGAGRDRVSEQRSSCPRPSGRPALLLHHQCCPQHSQHHLDGDTAVQCQPARAGTAKGHSKRMQKAKVCVYQVLSVPGGRAASDGPSLGRRGPGSR